MVSRKRIERAIVGVGLFLLSSLIYLFYVFRVWNSFDTLISGAPHFVISAISLGVLSSTFDFKRPLLTTFMLVAPAPIVSVYVYWGIGAALAGAPDVDMDAISLAFFIGMFSLLYGFLALVGNLLGRKLKAAIVRRVGRHQGGDSVSAAKIAALATFGGGLLTMFGAVLSAFIKSQP